MEVRIVSGVSILNFSLFKNLFRELRSKIGLHHLFGFGTKKNQLKSIEISEL